MSTFTWNSSQICNTSQKVITAYNAVMKEQNKTIPVRVFVIDKSEAIWKLSVFIACREDEITDTHIKWILDDIYDKISYDPNTSKRMLRWFVHYVDKLPAYVDNVFYQVL